MPAVPFGIGEPAGGLGGFVGRHVVEGISYTSSNPPFTINDDESWDFLDVVAIGDCSSLVNTDRQNTRA